MAMIDLAVDRRRVLHDVLCLLQTTRFLSFCVGSATGQHRLLSAESRAREARTRDPTPDPTRETHTSSTV